MEMPQTHLRRTILAAAASMGSFVGLASGSGNGSGGSTATQTQNTTVTQSQTVEIDYDKKPRISSTVEPCTKCTTDDGEQVELGTFVAYNSSSCQRKVTVEVTHKIALEGNPLKDQTLSLQIPPQTECVVGFTGSLVRVDAEHGHIDFTIAQRSEHLANHCEGEHRIHRDG